MPVPPSVSHPCSYNLSPPPAESQQRAEEVEQLSQDVGDVTAMKEEMGSKAAVLKARLDLLRGQKASLEEGGWETKGTVRGRMGDAHTMCAI